MSSLWQLCRLKRNGTPAIIFRELAKKPWVHRWWSQVLGFMHRLSAMPQSSTHVDIFKDTFLLPSSALSWWQLSCSRCEAVCRFGHAFPIFMFWNCCLESTRCPSKHEGSASQSLGWSACVPKAGPVQEGQVVNVLCMVLSPEPVAF